MPVTQRLIHLTKFISFHSHPHASHYNTLEAIITPKKIEKDLKLIMGKLKKEAVFLKYQKDLEPVKFLKTLAKHLKEGKTVFILTQTLQLHPVIYDQLINLREKNKFSVLDLIESKISPKAKLFLILKNDNKKETAGIFEVADHVLKLN